MSKKMNKTEKKVIIELRDLLKEAYMNVNHAGTLRLLINKAEKDLTKLLGDD